MKRSTHIVGRFFDVMQKFTRLLMNEFMTMLVLITNKKIFARMKDAFTLVLTSYLTNNWLVCINTNGHSPIIANKILT